MSETLPEEKMGIALKMSQTVAKCNFPDYDFNVILDDRGSIYLQGSYMEEDTVTGVPELQKTRRWFLSPEMTKDEIVQTVFKCVMTSLEHRCREWFTYREKPIFGPHFSVDSLWKICDNSEYSNREKTDGEPEPVISLEK